MMLRVTKAAAVFWYATGIPKWWKISLQKQTASFLSQARHFHQGSQTTFAGCFTCQWCISLKCILGNVHSNNANRRQTFSASEKHLLSVQKVLGHLPWGSWGREVVESHLGFKYLLRTIMFTIFLPHKVGQIWLQNISMLEVYFNNAHTVLNNCFESARHPSCNTQRRCCRYQHLAPCQ